MAYVPGDWSIDRATGNIRYIGDDHTLSGGTPSYATVIQAHRAWQALADDAEFTGDDELDIIDKNPSDRSTDNIIRLVNGFNLDATAIEHLYDGTIIQGSGPTEERWDGIVNFGNPDVHIQIIQDGAVIADDFWNYGHEAGTHTGAANQAVLTDSTLGATTDEFVGYLIKNITDGSQAIITANTATTVTGVLYGGTDNDWDAGDVHHIAVPLNADSGQGISHRFLLKTREDGVDIDRRRLIGISRRYGNTYSEFKINGTSQGNNVLALSDTGDLNNTTAWATINALADISNTEGLRLIDIDDDTVTEEYYSEWDRGANTINTFYEWGKLQQADGSVDTLNGLNGELFRGLTHSFAYDTETGTMFTTNDEGVYGTAIIFNTGVGTFQVGEAVHEDTATPAWKGRVLGGTLTGATGTIVVDVESGTLTNLDAFTGQTSGATAAINDASPPTVPTAVAGVIRFMAIDDDGTTGFLYGQILKGITPVDNTRIYDDASTANFIDVDTNAGADPVVERPVSTPFVGVSTGSALIGAYGLGLQKADTAAADTYFDLQNNPINPPNTVTFTASGFISGDYVLCTEDNANDINFTQMSGNLTLSGAAVTTVSVAAIPSDTPATAGTIGGIRIERDNGLYSLHRYTALDLGTDDFTIPSHDFSTNNATSPFNVFVSYLDLVTASTQEQFSYVYSADRTHFLRVRDGGATPIKNAETTGVMGNTGGTASVNRIDDT
jgi:hypothetical protein